MNCEQCDAKCCKNIFLPIKGITKDVKRWIELHGLETRRIKNIDYIKINNPCSKLVDNKCSIYEDRPQNCKDYKCEDNKDFL